jgi:hypothetical protein
MMKKMMFKPSLKKMKGLTLLETMFALALGVLVIIAIMLIYNGTKRSGVQSKVVTDITSIVSGFDNYIAAGNPGGTPSMTTVSAAGFLPAATIGDPLGQDYTITYNGAKGTVTVGVTGMPYSATVTDPCGQVAKMLNVAADSTVTATCTFNMPL